MEALAKVVLSEHTYWISHDMSEGLSDVAFALGCHLEASLIVALALLIQKLCYHAEEAEFDCLIKLV